MKKNRIKTIILLIFIVIVSGVFLYTKLKPDVKYIPVMKQYDYNSVTVNDEKISNTTNSTDRSIPQEFSKVAENDRLELYLEEESIAIAVRDKSNGYTWFSYDVDMDFTDLSQEMLNYVKSGISVVTYDKFTPGRRTVLDNKVKKTYQKDKDGFIVTVDFLTPMIKFDMVVKLQGGDLLINIPHESINEYHPKLWKPGNDDVSINEMIIYPFLGSTEKQDDGYIVIPDGSGGIVNLDDVPEHVTGYSSPVYGKDLGYENTLKHNFNGISVKPLERVTLPIYGIVHEVNNAGVLVIAESGTSYATYNYNSKNLTTNYYQSYFTYNYRTAYSQFLSRVDEFQHILGFQEKPNKFDLVQRYVFLNNKDANYVGVAKKYRDFLVKKDNLTKKNDNDYDSLPLKIDFINNEVEQGTFKEINVPTTTYKQTREIADFLLNKGYKNLNVTLKSFILDESTYRFDILKCLGGLKDYNKLIEYFKDKNINYSYYVDYTKVYGNKKNTVASKMSRQDLEIYNNSYMYTRYYLNNPKYFDTFASKDIDRYIKHRVNNIAFDGFSGSLFTHYDKGTIGYSNEGMAFVENLLQKLKDNNIKTSAYLPDSYLYAYIDEMYDTPIVSSELMVTDYTIPLVSLVVSGYIDMYSPYMNFASNESDSILRLIEYGVYPSFLLTASSTYELKHSNSSEVYVTELKYLEDRIDKYYSQINKALSGVLGKEIINHTIIDNGVVLVEYDNGTQILINYNDSEYKYKGVKIESKGFVIL